MPNFIGNENPLGIRIGRRQTPKKRRARTDPGAGLLSGVFADSRKGCAAKGLRNSAGAVKLQGLWGTEKFSRFFGKTRKNCLTNIKK